MNTWFSFATSLIAASAGGAAISAVYKIFLDRRHRQSDRRRRDVRMPKNDAKARIDIGGNAVQITGDSSAVINALSTLIEGVKRSEEGHAADVNAEDSTSPE